MSLRSLAAELLPAALHGLQRAPLVQRETPPPAAEVQSFAALADRLGYLSKADLKLVREAYKFADQAHLGQFRANGQPYITHPIAVAGLCADWKLDAQAIMAALMHDTIEDCGVTKTELIEKFGAATADLVDGLTKLDKLQFNTREESQAESFRKMLLAMARDVRVILIKLADRLHNMRTMQAMAPERRQRIARETLRHLRPHRAPAGPEPDLPRTAGAVLRAAAPLAPRGAGQGRAARARPPARHRRARAEGRREGLRAAQAQGPGLGAREDHLLDLPQDAREARRLRAGQRHLRLSHRRAHADRLLRRPGRAAPALQAGAGPLQGLHRDPQGQRLPEPAHHAGQPAGHGGGIPGAHRGHARGGRKGHRGALAVQDRRQGRRQG